MDASVDGLVQATLLGDAIATSRHAVLVSEEDGGRIVAANEAACALLGYRRDELLRLLAREVAARPGPETDAVYARLRVPGASVFERARLRRRDGALVEIGYWGSHTRIGAIDYLLTVTEPIDRAVAVDE